MSRKNAINNKIRFYILNIMNWFSLLPPSFLKSIINFKDVSYVPIFRAQITRVVTHFSDTFNTDWRGVGGGGEVTYSWYHLPRSGSLTINIWLWCASLCPGLVSTATGQDARWIFCTLETSKLDLILFFPTRAKTSQTHPIHSEKQVLNSWSARSDWQVFLL